MAKISAGAVLDLISFSQAENKIGDIKTSMLTLAEFQSEHLGQWMLMDGSSCVGTAYATLKGVTNVPNATTEGTFLRQAKSGRVLGSYEADDNRAHKHRVQATSGASSAQINVNATGFAGWANSAQGFTAGNNLVEDSGSGEARPKNLAVNFFIKVGY